MKKQQAAGGQIGEGSGQNVSISGDAYVICGSNPGDDVVDEDFKEV